MMKTNKWILLMIAAFFLSGCNGGAYASKGTTAAKQKNLIQLQQGNHQGTWKTNEIALNYDCQVTPETLKISGTVSLVGGFALSCNVVKRLVVQLIFLDSEETIIKTVFFYSANNYHPINLLPMNFDTSIAVPTGTQTMTFDYDGELTGCPGGPPTVSIWYSPF